MNRIERFRHLAKLEEDKSMLEAMLKDADSPFFKGFGITVTIETSDFNRYANQTNTFEPSRRVFTEYLESELANTKAEILRHFKLAKEDA